MSTTRALLVSSCALISALLWACESAGRTPDPEREETAGLSNSVTAADDGPRLASPFLEAERCALCHSRAPRARALTTATGEDASPFATWQATLMANSFRDPYWRAQMAHEVEQRPEERAEIEGLCLRCHAPLTHHAARLAGEPQPALFDLVANPLALEGVSCTACHRTQAAGLGSEASFDGRLPILDEPAIFGPFPEPAQGPMNMHTGYTPTYGEHISSSALCGACHTLRTTHAPGAEPFVEQSPYLEWRNSSFSSEGPAGRTEGTRECQECHMPDMGDMKIARNPRGLDFNIETRRGVRAHTFVGGNALMLDLLRENAEAFGVEAPAAALDRLAQATRAQLAHSTAELSIGGVRRAGTTLAFDVEVVNLTGHKLPTGYPSRRAWLSVEVRAGNDTVFSSGAHDADGRLVGVENELTLAHHDRVTEASQVVVYELVAEDSAGTPTTSLVSMAARTKDSRLLPAGWRADGPHADATRPVGTDGDDDFGPGGDVVHYRLELPGLGSSRAVIVAQLHYQAIPPAWADGLRDSGTSEAAAFLGAYDSLEKRPETIAVAVEFAEP